MIKQMAWNTFKKTGSIDTFLELMQVQNIEKNIGNDVQRIQVKNVGIEKNGFSKNNRNYYSGK